MQPGSSIMPGKVNPVIPEVVNQICFDVIGGDVTVTMAAEAGQLQLNVFEPVIAYRLLRSIETLENGCRVLQQRCVAGITANPGRMRYFVEHSIGIVTALVPVIGYEQATSVAKEALESGQGVFDVVMARGLMTREQLERALDPDTMAGKRPPLVPSVLAYTRLLSMPPRRRKRLDPAAFNLPVDQIRQGFYTDAYFVRAREIVRQDKRSPAVTLQFSGKTEGWVSGIDEAIAILKLCVDDWSALTVHALYEGDRYESWDTVLTIEGPYEAFGYLETLCLGTLARRTRVCTNAKLISDAAASKPVMVFGARDDAFLMQPGDGYSAMVGGVKFMSTDAQASLFGGKIVATIPHALIALCGGDTVKATKRFAEMFEGVDLIALVDYANDSVKTSVDVAKALEGRLWGVRLDTAETMVDKSVVLADGRVQADGCECQPRVERAQRARRRRVWRGEDRRVGRIRRAADLRVRGGRRSGGRVRRRLGAVRRPVRLHGGHRPGERQGRIEGRPGVAREPERWSG